MIDGPRKGEFHSTEWLLLPFPLLFAYRLPQSDPHLLKTTHGPQKQMHQWQSHQSGNPVVGHHAQSVGQFFQSFNWGRLGDIEQAKQQEPDEEGERLHHLLGRDEKKDDRQGRDFIPDDGAGVFFSKLATGCRAERNAYRAKQDDQNDLPHDDGQPANRREMGDPDR